MSTPRPPVTQPGPAPNAAARPSAARPSAAHPSAAHPQAAHPQAAPNAAARPPRKPAVAQPPPVYPKRRGYRHGYVQEAAVKRGLEVIAERGPSGLTMRGIARDLGIAASTLVYYYGNLEGLRQAVADAIAERMSPHARMNARRDDAAALLVENGLRWSEFAAENPHWYAFAAGVEWRRRPHGAKGPGTRGQGSWFGPAHTCLATMRRTVAGGWAGGVRDAQPGHPPRAERAALAAVAAYAGIHGVAMARAEGLLARQHVVPILLALASAAAV